MQTAIEFAGGKTITYTYSADGHKLRAVYATTTPATSKRIDYCGNLIFENGQLKQILVDGGYMPLDDSSGAYRFYMKDHLGNNRMVVHPSGNVEQINNYYPYGGLMANSSGWNTQRYKYNGKELDRMHGLDWYDYGARWMDATLARWHSMDPLCEKYYDVSPYLYCLGNPINQFDPDGRNPWKVLAKGAFKVSKAFAKQGFSALTKTATYADAFNDITEDTKTVFDSKASTTDRILAGVSLASEVFSPVSVKDAKGVVQTANNLTKREIQNARRSAVRKAWKQEKNMVEKDGKGSRRWTREQKAELSETGKIKGYEGHYINNVKDHPEMAGNSDNVIFVNREEHLQIHGGNFRNTTEGELIKREIKNE